MPDLRLADHVMLDWKNFRREVLKTGFAVSARHGKPLTAKQQEEVLKDHSPSGELLLDEVITRMSNSVTPADADYYFDVSSRRLAADVLANAPVVVADNLSEQFFEKHFGKGGVAKSSAVIPYESVEEAAPPFPECFVEWSVPELGKGGKVGALVSTCDLSKGKLDEEQDAMMQKLRKTGADLSGSRWSVLMAFFALLNGEVEVHQCGMACVLSESGNILASFGTNRPGRTNEENLTPGAYLMLVLSVFSFMNCRNVECVETTQEFAQTEKWHRRQKTPKLSYYTLRVKKRPRKEGESVLSGDTILRAEHICRGHYARYTEEKPLFGKLVGRFWKPQHVRGSSDAGTVKKDYSV